MIRGKHATGISFLPWWSADIVTISDSISADKFVDIHLTDDKLSDLVNADGNLYLIGHCRYSTSDLLYNQPISNETTSIAHNGVITQEDPSQWESNYGYTCATRNDSELVLHSLSPLEEFQDASMAVCELGKDTKSITYYRNGKRPLYFTSIENGSIITSTRDIPRRANLKGETVEVDMNAYHKIDKNLTVTVERISIEAKDLQKVKYETISV
jgi:glutamine phosphoribosylpyrophosphate amidotransferase